MNAPLSSSTSTNHEAELLYQKLDQLERENQQLRQQIGRDQIFFTQGPLIFFTWVYAEGWPVAYVCRM